jgi:hypothetical protein
MNFLLWLLDLIIDDDIYAAKFGRFASKGINEQHKTNNDSHVQQLYTSSDMHGHREAQFEKLSTSDD